MEKLIRLSFVIFSAIAVIAYLWYTVKKYGWLSSISATCGKLKDDKKAFLFSGFITFGIAVPLAFAAQSILATFGAAALFTISVNTGYNIFITDKKAEDYSHVIMTNLGILVMILQGFFWKSVLNDITIAVFVLFTIYQLIKDSKYHTTWIEIAAIIMSYILIINHIYQ